MSAEIDLDNARKVIAAEECQRFTRGGDAYAWCRTHRSRWLFGRPTCPRYSKVADVAADLSQLRNLRDALGSAEEAHNALIGTAARLDETPASLSRAIDQTGAAVLDLRRMLRQAPTPQNDKETH